MDFKFLVLGRHPVFQYIKYFHRHCLTLEEAENVRDGLEAVGYEVAIGPADKAVITPSDETNLVGSDSVRANPLRFYCYVENEVLYCSVIRPARFNELEKSRVILAPNSHVALRIFKHELKHGRYTSLI
jgi:hypothetical protein